MEQEIDTNALGGNRKKIKNNLRPWDSVDIYELGLIYDVMVNTDYK
jgi:hypothetical protein